MKKTLLFDFDGVIVNTFPFCYEIWGSLSKLSEDEYRKRFEGNIHDSLHKAQDASAKIDFFSLYTPQLMKCEPHPEMAEIVKELSKRYRLIIISSTITSSIVQYLDMRGIKDCFEEVLGSDVEKSKVRKIELTLKKYSIKPEETLFITDTLGDIREAERCGVRSVAVTWGYHPRKTLEIGNPCAIVDDSTKLAKAIEDCLQ